MKAKLKNLLSRKFLISLFTVAGGLGMGLKAVNNPSVQIAGIIVACVAAVGYSVIEGQCDVESIASTITDAVREIEDLTESNEVEG